MSLIKKLDNPFLLAAQGFVVGAILFLSAHPDTLHAFTGKAAAAAHSVSQGNQR